MIRRRISEGQIFGRLTIVNKSVRPGYFLVLCICGKEKTVYRGSLISGATRSCGCLHKEKTAEANTKRKQSKRKETIFVKIELQNLPGEAWKPVVGWSAFMVSNKGRVKRLRGPNRNDSILKPRPEIGLMQDGRSWGGRVAVLILTAFVGPAPKGKPLARHLDDNIKNNVLENLAWGSHSDNMQDALRNGRHKYRQTLEYRQKLSSCLTGIPRRRRAA